MHRILSTVLLLIITTASSKATIPYAPTNTQHNNAAVISAMNELTGAGSANDDVLAVSPFEMLAEAEGFSFEDEVKQLSSPGAAYASIKNDLVAFAKRYLGRPYRSGAKGPSAFDCSGFTGYIFRSHGYALGADSRIQSTQGSHITADEVEPGDLIFFSGRRGGRRVGHVGMIIDVDRSTGKMKFIHAASRKGVVIQNYPDGAYYSSHFLKFRRVVDDEKLISKR